MNEYGTASPLIFTRCASTQQTRPLPQAGEDIKADPRCIVYRGIGLQLRPPETPDRGSVLQGLKAKLLKTSNYQERNRDPLQKLSNTMASSMTDCLLASPFPGEIAKISVNTAQGSIDDQTKQLPRDGTDRRKADDDAHRHREISAPSERLGGSGRGTVEDRTLVLVTQTLVAVGPGVVVTPLPAGAAVIPTRGGGSGGGSDQKPGALSLCEGQGSIAIAGCGRLKKVRLRAGQTRLVDSSRAVGWTRSVSRRAVARGRTSASAKDQPPIMSFVGPGVVYIQTHSLAGLRRLLLPKGGRMSLYGGVPDFRGYAPAGQMVPSRRITPGLSLRRGLAKRARARAKRILLAVAFFGLYIMIYSYATAFLLEGRDGIVNGPRHALQVVRSLTKVARRVALVLVRLGQEELWRTEGGQGGGTKFLEAKNGASER